MQEQFTPSGNPVQLDLVVISTLVANPQSVAVPQNTAKVITLTGSAPNGDPITFAVGTGPAHGTLGSINQANGQVTYTPAAGYTGPDSFTFTVTDTTTSLTSSPATVSITVAVPPMANGQTVTVQQDTAKVITLTGSAPNGDSFTFAVGTGPAHGTLGSINQANGQVTYTPAAGYTGPDSFTFTVTDTTTSLTSSPATVSITVSALPTANGQAVTVQQDTAKVITLTGSAPNGDSFTFAIGTGPAHGTLGAINQANGQVTYTPAAGYTGPDSFTFTVTDTTTSFVSNPATVSITVAAPPTANGQAVTVQQNTAKVITLTGSTPTATPSPSPSARGRRTARWAASTRPTAR